MDRAGEALDKQVRRRAVPPGTVLLLMLFVAGVAVRVWANSQSLWYDELYTIAFHVSRSWWDIVAAGPYSPNNHILSTLLIKAVAGANGALTAVPGAKLPVMLATENTMCLRLVSIVAGAMLGLALAWKMRERTAGAALLGGVAVLLPWLVASSTEARGYTLMLLLAAVGTNCLDSFEKRFSWGYVGAMVGAIYTVPIGGEALLGHAVAMALLHRAGLKRWVMAAGVVLGVSGLLYWPMVGGIVHHIGTPEPGQMAWDTGAYFFALGQHLATGWSSGNLWVVAIAGMVLLVGTALAWRVRVVRDSVVTFGVATLVAVGCAMVVPNMRGTRLAIWAAPLLVFAVFGVAVWLVGWAKQAGASQVRAAAFGAGALVVMGWADVRLAAVEPQPILWGLRDADRAVAKRAEHDATIVGVYLGAQESVLYWQALTHDMDVAYTVEQLQGIEKKGREVWVVVYYEDALRMDRPELAGYIEAHYVLDHGIPGRISPVAVYGPQDATRPGGGS